MLKKRLLSFMLLFSLLFSLSLPAQAEEGISWIKFTGTVPEGFNLEVFASVKNKDTGKVYSTTIRPSAEYVGYISVEPGNYTIQSISISDEYATYFDVGYSTQAITVSKDAEDAAVVAYMVEVAESPGKTAVKESSKETDENLTDSDKEYEDGYDEDFYEDEQETDPLSEEEYMETVKEEQKEKEKTKQVQEQKQEEKTEFWVSLGLTCVALGALAIVYYYLKQKRDL